MLRKVEKQARTIDPGYRSLATGRRQAEAVGFECRRFWGNGRAFTKNFEKPYITGSRDARNGPRESSGVKKPGGSHREN